MSELRFRNLERVIEAPRLIAGGFSFNAQAGELFFAGLEPLIISTNTVLRTGLHGSRLLVCTAPVTLTVDDLTGFLAQECCGISAEGGAVTLAQAGAVTISRPGSDPLTIMQFAEAILRRTQNPSVYTLKGGLG